MLERLIESSSHREENKKRGVFLLTAFVLVAALFASGVLWSLFAKDLAMRGGDLEFSALVAPVPVPEDAPPAPVEKVEKRESLKTENQVAVRQTDTLRIEESPLAPDKISTAPNALKPRPNGAFKISNGIEAEAQNFGSSKISRDGAGGGLLQAAKITRQIADDAEPAPLPKAKKPAIDASANLPKKPPVSIGVVNGRATNLPKPLYPPAAKAVRAEGDVSVQVTIDEQGNVVSARAVSGHPLLRQVSEAAARSARFSPTFLSNQPVKVTGIIVYKFAVQ